MIIHKDGYIICLDCWGCPDMRICKEPCSKIEAFLEAESEEQEIIEPD
jgi:hypothetical protein